MRYRNQLLRHVLCDDVTYFLLSTSNIVAAPQSFHPITTVRHLGTAPISTSLKRHIRPLHLHFTFDAGLLEQFGPQLHSPSAVERARSMSRPNSPRPKRDALAELEPNRRSGEVQWPAAGRGLEPLARRLRQVGRRICRMRAAPYRHGTDDSRRARRSGIEGEERRRCSKRVVAGRG